MITFDFDGHKIKMWESIDEMPISRFMSYNKYMMIGGSFGSTFEDIDRVHIASLVQILDDKVKALQQINNLRELIFNVLKGINYEHSAFVTMIYSIDGELVTDMSESGIEEVKKRLNEIGLTNEDIKKKTIVQGMLYMTN